MEYALEGYGYCRSRVIREALSRANLPVARRRQVDLMIDRLAHLDDVGAEPFIARMIHVLRQLAGVVIERPEPPPELLATLLVQAPESSLAGLTLDVATSVKGVFDGLRRRGLDVRLTHCTFDANSAARLVLGAWSLAITADVAPGDTVAAGSVVALHGDPGGGVRLEVLSRLFRKICENGAVMYAGDTAAEPIVWTTRQALADELERRFVASLDGQVFASRVEQIRRSAADELGPDAGPLAASLRLQLTHEEMRGVMQRYSKEAWTRWSLANAVTAEARWAPSFAEATRLEQLGGVIACTPALAGGSLGPGRVERQARKKVGAA
jgi:hypothetical protein